MTILVEFINSTLGGDVMANVIPFGSEGPELSVFVDARDKLDLGNVARFLQRLDTGARRVATWQGLTTPMVQIVSLNVGSPLDVKLKVEKRRLARATVAISAAALAVGVAEYLRGDPAANKASRALIEGDHATVIIVKGGDRQERITARDLEDVELEHVAAARAAPEYELLTGPQTGFVRYFGGEFWVELDARPGLIIRIRDEREEPDRLGENAHYNLDGEAHISGARRGESFFLLRRALILQ